MENYQKLYKEPIFECFSIPLAFKTRVLMGLYKDTSIWSCFSTYPSDQPDKNNPITSKDMDTEKTKESTHKILFSFRDCLPLFSLQIYHDRCLR